MVRYKTEADDREQRALAEISLNTPVNRKKTQVNCDGIGDTQRYIRGVFRVAVRARS